MSAAPETDAAALPPLPRSDVELVVAMAAGERQAVAELYDRYAPALLMLAERMLHSRAESEDMVHDLFLEAWQQSKSYDAQRGSVRTWLVMRLRSRSLDRLRSAGRKRAVSLESSVLEEIPQIDAGDPLAGHSGNQMRRALLKLSDGERKVLDLAYFAGLTLSEVARELSLPLGTVKSRLGHALRTLRQDLAAVARRGQP